MLRCAKTAFLLLILSLPFMKPAILVGGLAVTATDVLFLVSAAALAGAILAGTAKLRWNAFYAVLAIYFAAMLVSALGSAQPGRSALKLASQAYLLSLPVLAFALVDSREQLRAAFQWWLAATAVVAGLGTLAVLLFALGADGPLLDYALHPYGTLPPGNYPRLEATFAFPAMLCNYLTVSLMILLVAWRLGWVGPLHFYALAAMIGVTAAFSLTPGLGGMFLALGLWLFVELQDRAPRVAVTGLWAGGLAALLFVLAATVTPIVHPTAPFLIDIPGVAQDFAPAVRLMTWIDAAQRFVEHPLTGAGIGTDAVAVRYVGPSGKVHLLTDAHNVFLNIAVQCGLLGLSAMILLIVKVARATGRLRLDGYNFVRLGLGLAWLNAFVYQGLTGSYEDARHLWLLLGLLLAGIRFEVRECSRSQSL